METTASTPRRPASVLFPPDMADEPLSQEPPSCFHDLMLDQLAASLMIGREEYDLGPHLYTPLVDPGAIIYRQAVVTDLLRPELRAHLQEFAEGMRRARKDLDRAGELRHHIQQRIRCLTALGNYQKAVGKLATDLSADLPASAALTGIADELRALVEGEAFTVAVNEREALETELAELRYAIHIEGPKVTVTPDPGDGDYSEEIEATFLRFRQAPTAPRKFANTNYPEMNHVEASILDLVAQLNPGFFERLKDYVDARMAERHAVVDRFTREIQFYLAYLDLLDPLKNAGLDFCLPHVTDRKESRVRAGFDVVLAGRLTGQGTAVVTNDFTMSSGDRIIVVTGANQGGKTTFARTFGQLHYLGALGYPVPGNEAELHLFDRLLTHFEHEENLHDLHGKLEDELVRMKSILDEATGQSIIIANEVFASTALQDAISLGTAILRTIIDRDIVCVCVTFVDELSTLSDTTMSLVAAVDPQDADRRTFRLEPRPADGLAYALAISDKHGLSEEKLGLRLSSAPMGTDDGRTRCVSS